MRGSYLNDPCRDLRHGEPDDEPEATEPSLAAQDRAEDLLVEFVADHPPTAHVIALARELERWAAEALDAAKVYAAPPWLSDVAEALGMVRPEDGAPLALNWTQAVNGIRDLMDERDECRREAKHACVTLADGFVPKAERAGAHLQGLPRLVAHAVEHHQWHHDAHDSAYVKKLEEELYESRRHLLADEERRKLTGDAIVAEDKLARIAAIVNGAFNGESPLDREQRATKALAAVAGALGVPF